ncbi:alpha/beta-hydrolase [Exidia glandulosa HHB12029]|uniref:Alpha/beta-hydrolase n=1 Tax=Exidia glandulosa HHB12029 TaxID=1314781 RepID=A0A165ELL5_EXIGL|nr:alpha/beta-hydrolase [Exidia glandulosa HHB12029]
MLVPRLLLSTLLITMSATTAAEFILHVPVSATNYDISSGVLPPNATIPVSGTYGIELHLSAPSSPSPTRTLHVLVSGATYGSDYWDVGFEPERYSYVRYFTARGYWTLCVQRLGNGKSDHPDGMKVVQVPLDVEILAYIVHLARTGGLHGHVFEKIVYAGHSYGSAILNGIIAKHPGVIDAAIFTGFSHPEPDNNDDEPGETIDPTGATPIPGFQPAHSFDPVLWGSLPPSYIVTLPSTRPAFYGADGTYDPVALAWDIAHMETATTGQILTNAATKISAPEFKGDVLTVDGEGDGAACPTGCDLKGEKEYYPAARSVEFAIIPGAGHALNFHLSAPTTYETIYSWLKKHGY